MGIYNRAAPGRKKNFWLKYTLPDELQAKHGLTTNVVREPANTGDERAARSILAQRKREVRDGSWEPTTKRGEGGSLAAYVDEWCAKRVASGVVTARNEEQRLRDYVLPVLGSKPLGAVKRADVTALMANIQAEPSKHTGKPHAPRTVHRIYEALRTLYNTAVLDELVPASPCTLRIKREELPPKKDKNPRWRSKALFTREEIAQLISDKRIHPQRRVLYAIAFLTGTRLGEVTGRRWQDYDPTTKPLGTLSVATQYDDLELKGQRPERAVPVHPLLAAILAEWRGTFALVYGRRPTEDDFIVPKRSQGRGTVGFTPGAIGQQTVWGNLQRDLDTLGLRHRRVHDSRRSFISLAVADGADKYLLKWITHGPQKADAFDDYLTPQWASLCAQVAKLCISLPTTEAQTEAHAAETSDEVP